MFANLFPASVPILYPPIQERRIELTGYKIETLVTYWLKVVVGQVDY